jgi:hypothetical protein
MFASPRVLLTVHTILLFGFIGVTSVLMLVTVINRLRVQHIRLTWRTGRVLGLPALPCLFMALVFGFLVHAAATDQPLFVSILGGYLVGGGFWFVAVLLSTATIVTEAGIIRNVNRRGQAVAWGQILDYFEHTFDGESRRVVFLYFDERGRRRRFEVHVPERHLDRFTKIVHGALEARIGLTPQRAFGKKTLER